jgi:hypothetical protein
MSIVGSIAGESLAAPINAVGNVISKLYTTPGEKLDKEAALERLLQQPDMAQIELNKAEAQHRSMFVAGWRPFIGWGLGLMVMLGCFMEFFVRPILACFNIHMPMIQWQELVPLLGGLLGLSGWRSFDKKNNKTITFGQPELPIPTNTRGS